MTFGENLKTLRNARSFSQKDLAEELGFSFQNISKWERNESIPDIETLLAIAKFFGTTTDDLLGYAVEEKFSTLKIDDNEVKIFNAYPESEEKVTNNIIFAIDGEHKITGIVFIPHMRQYKTGYIRDNYELMNEQSTIIYEHSYRSRSKPYMVVDNKKINIPENGFIISVPGSAFAAKKIMNFIIPEEYQTYLDPDSHAGYYNSRNGKSLFSDILKHNELDHISVEMLDGGLLFKKTAETVDPMSVNIETLAKVIRKELQKEHNKQLDELKNRIDEISDIAEDNENTIDELEGRIDDLESMISELKSLLKQQEVHDKSNK